MKKFLFIMASVLPLFTFIGCSGDDNENKIDTTPISLYVGDSEKIEMDFVPTKTVSENDFIAKVEKDGTIEGEHVGATNIVIDDKYTISVEVKGKVTTYDDPITKWGCNSSYIKENQKQGTWSTTSDKETLVYENCGKADLLMYMMEGNKLTSVGVAIESKYASEMGEYLAERYFMIPYDLGDYTIGGIDAYEAKNAKTFVAIRVYSIKYLMVLYIPYNEKDTKTNSFIYKDDLIKRMDNIANRHFM